MDKTRALQNLLNGTASEEEIESLRQALASGEISIGGDVNRSVVIIGSGNRVELTAEALGILKPESQTQEEPVAGEPPYMGLRYFDTQDVDLFYGREALTRELLARVKNESFLAIVGASGSGKSSVARAGLIPAWKKENERSAIHIITPTAHPLESLAASLTRGSESVTATSTLMDDLAKDTRSLRLYVKKLLAGVGKSQGSGEPNTLLLLVDQFEETFTLCKDMDERKAFIENLLSLADDDGAARVVVTLRADFYHHCAEYEGLRNALKSHQEYIGAMTPEELREAITMPAQKNGWDFQPGLVDLILQDVGAEPGALPLLSHALLETWKRRQGYTLTLQGYADAGGVKKAIAQTAENTYDHLSPAEQDIARDIFLRLTELGEGVQDTRRRVNLDELVWLTRTHDEVVRVLKILTDARLVTTAEDSAEVAHEALIREWNTLRHWLDEDRESLRLHRHLAESAREWENAGRDELFLIHRGSRLDDALKLRSQLNTQEQAYLDNCKKIAQRQQRTIVTGISLALLIIMAILIGWALTSNANSKQLAAQVEEVKLQRNSALALQLAAQSQLLNINIGKYNIQTGLLAIEAAKLGAGLPADQALRRYLSKTSLPIANMFHDDAVLTVSVSPNSQLIASGGQDNSVRVWDDSGKEISRMYHDSRVNVVVFSPDGKHIISASQDNTVRVWNALNGQELKRMTHDGEVTSIAISPDGIYIASGSRDRSVRIWNVDSGVEIMRFNHDDWITSIAFCNNGNFVVSGSQDGTVRVWDIKLREESARMVHRSRVTSVAFSPNCETVVSGGFDMTARVWETETGKEVSRMTHNNWVIATNFSPNGKYVISGGSDGTARVWEAENGYEVSRMALDAWITSAVFSPNGDYVISGSSVGMVRVWDAYTGLEIAHVAHDEAAYSVISPNGKFIVSGSNDHSVRIWVIDDGGSLFLMEHGALVTSINFSPDGRYIASSGADNTARVWDILYGYETSSIVHDKIVTSISFSPYGGVVVSSSQDGTARIWEVATGHEICRMTHDEGVSMAIFSPDAQYVATASESGVLQMWEISTCRNTTRMIHNYPITLLAFSPDGKYIASGSLDYTARIWDMEDGQEVSRISHDGHVNSVAFSPDGKYLLSGGSDRIARVSEVSTGDVVSFIEHVGGVMTVAFTPDGRYAASGSDDGEIKIWEAANGKELFNMFHDTWVNSIMFSPDGKHIVSGSLDKTIRVWNVGNGAEEARIPQDDGITSVVFSPNGEYIASGSRTGKVRVIYPFTEELIMEACKRIPRSFTQDEWHQYIGTIFPYQEVCSGSLIIR